MKTLMIIILLTVLTCIHKPVQAGAAAGGSTELTQILNNVQLLAQVFKQAQTLLKIKKQFENMIQNTEKWEQLFFGRGMDMMLELSDAVSKNELLNYTSENIAEEFSEKYPGYEEYLELGIEGWTSEKIQEEHIRWSKANKANITAALEAANIHQKEFETEEDLINELKIQASTAVGRQQLLQAGNSIAIEGLRQSQKTRQLVLTQIQLQTNYQAYEASKEAAKRAIADAHAADLQKAHQEKIILGDGEKF